MNIKPSRQLNFIPIRITNRSLENEYDLIERMRSNRNVHNYSNLIKVQRLKPTIPQRSLPNILTLNARSILNKMDELAFVIHNHNSDIVIVSETCVGNKTFSNDCLIVYNSKYRTLYSGNAGSGVRSRYVLVTFLLLHFCSVMFYY